MSKFIESLQGTYVTWIWGALGYSALSLGHLLWLSTAPSESSATRKSIFTSGVIAFSIGFLAVVVIGAVYLFVVTKINSHFRSPNLLAVMTGLPWMLALYFLFWDAAGLVRKFFD